MRPGRAFGAVLAVVTIVVLVAGAALTPQRASADSISVNELHLSQRSIAMTGNATGNATSGPAVATNEAIVVQKSVQVVAGGPRSGADNTQTSVNYLDLNQAAIATSGDASGTDGGTASSGAATAGNLAIVHQLNVQIIAGWVPEGGLQQDAVNVADIDQTSVAASGDANATGDGSNASSGDASAFGFTFVQQRNIQIYVGRPDTASIAGSVHQSAANVATVDQVTGAISGTATASVSSTGNSGSASSSASTMIRQGALQLAGE